MSEHARPAARVLPPPIYLHFLDRELGEAYEFQLDLNKVQAAFAALALGTASTLFCSISAIFENPGLRGGEGMVGDLVEAGALVPQSTHATLSEFLETRLVMYEHDRGRYPRYFADEPLGPLGDIVPRLAPIAAPGTLPPSTTERMHRRLEAWTEGESTVPSTTRTLLAEPRRRMMDFVSAELGRREGRAVTYAMFDGVKGGDPSGQVLERTVRQRISLEYTDHQRSGDGQLVTGVAAPLEPIEHALQPLRPFEYDVPVLLVLLDAAGLGAFLSGWPRGPAQLMLALRGSPEHVRLVSRIQWIARALDLRIPPHLGFDIRRRQAITAIRSVAPALSGTVGADPINLLIDAEHRLEGVGERLGERGLQPELARSADALVPLRADVLLVVATEIEQQKTFEAFGFAPRGKHPQAYPKGHRIYFDLGEWAGERVFLVRSGMGSGGVSGSLFTADDAIADLRPNWTLMVGIAFGTRPEEQEIGDVLVPTHVILYDHRRMGTDDKGELEVIYRDSPGAPDPALLERLKAAELDAGETTVRFGPLLSGSELVDNEGRRKELVDGASGGTAIGGEMELPGVFAAASRREGRWAAAKAICDFADGKKKERKQERQELAANEAASFVRQLIERGLLGSPPD